MTVIKRDGREVPFDEQKINAALIKAEKKIHGSLSPITYEKIQSIARTCDQRNQRSLRK